MNLVLKLFVEGGSNVDMEMHISKELFFRGGVTGTTAVLLDASDLPNKYITRTFKSSMIGSRSTLYTEWKTSEDDHNRHYGVEITST